MDEDALLEAAPLLQGELLGRREEIRTNLVKFGLSLESCPEEFTIEKLQILIHSDLNVDLDETSISNGLKELSVEGYVEYTSDRTYIIQNRPEVPAVDHLIEPVWEEFSGRMSQADADFDEHIDSGVKRAFHEFLMSFFLELAETSQDMAEIESDSFFNNDFTHVLEDIAQNKNIQNPELFISEILDYMKNPGEELTQFTNIVYNGIVNLDLIAREEEQLVDLREASQDGKIIFLDTNVLVSLFCETDKTHPIVATACERARELGFDLYYIPETVDEMETLIQGTVNEITGLDPSRDMDGLTDSQFAEYYLHAYEEPESFASDLNNWQSTLESKHGVAQIEGDTEVSQEIAGWVKTILSQFNRETHGHDPERKINHDTILISIAATLRNQLDTSIPTGPFVLSRDSQVTRVSSMGKGVYWSRSMALQPRSWVHYLMAFSPANVRGDHDDIAIALLRGAAGTDFEDISIEKYAKLLATKTGVDKELLSQYLQQHPVSNELSNALSRRDGQDAEKLVIEAFEGDYPGQFDVAEDLKEDKEELENRLDTVASKLKEKDEELEATREKKKLLEKALSGDMSVVVDVDSESVSASEANATALNVTEQSVRTEVEGLVDLLESSLPEDLDENPPEPPSNTDNWEEVTEWLESLNVWLNSTSHLWSGAEFVQSQIPDLLQKVEYLQ